MSTPASAHKRGRRRAGATIVRTAPVRLTRAMLDDGTRINEQRLVTRVGYLVDLVAELATSALADHWDQDSLARYADAQAAFAYKAWAQTFGWQSLPAGIYVPSRVVWLAQEVAGRTLRSAFQRAVIADALIKADGEPDLAKRGVILHQLLPKNVDAVSLRSLRRRIERFRRGEGRTPVSFFELEPTTPRVAQQAPLAATDRQLCEISDDGTLIDGAAITLRLRLPLVPRPAKRTDWAWHAITLRRPEHISGSVCRPTLRLSHGRAIADLPLERDLDVAIAQRQVQHQDRPRRALGLDWGVATPLVGAMVWIGEDGRPVSDGRPLHFKAAGILSKLGRLKRQREYLATKIQGITALSPDPGSSLGQRLVVLKTEVERVSTRQRHLNAALAHAVSRWTLEQALAHEADTIVLEDLTSLESGDLGRRTNGRVSDSVRGQIKLGITYKAQEIGIRVIIAPPRGTSSHCPACGQPTKHFTAPDSSKPGYRWMRCPNPACATSLDRDHAAAMRIAGRGLAPAVNAVARIKTSPAPRPHPGTTPARGPHAKIRRTRYEGSGAGSPITPHRHSAGHRSAGAEAQVSVLTQLRGTLPVASLSSRDDHARRPPRRLDGLRSALLGMVRVSPIPWIPAPSPSGPDPQVSTG